MTGSDGGTMVRVFICGCVYIEFSGHIVRSHSLVSVFMMMGSEGGLDIKFAVYFTI